MKKISEVEMHDGHRNQAQATWRLFKAMEKYFLCSVCPPEFLWLLLLDILSLYCGSCNIQAFTSTTEKQAASKIKMQRGRDELYFSCLLLPFISKGKGRTQKTPKPKAIILFDSISVVCFTAFHFVLLLQSPNSSKNITEVTKLTSFGSS